MNNKLADLVNEIEIIREDDNPVKAAWLNACQRLGFLEEDPIVVFGLMFSNHEDLIYSPNSYHNQLHAADAITSASFLAREEFPQYELKENGIILLFAMMCHDIAHNGGHNQYNYQLEEEAVNSVDKYLKNNPELLVYWKKTIEPEFGKWEDFFLKVKEIILGTDFKIGPLNNLQSYLESDIPLPIDRLKLLANEADILPSCISSLGPMLGEKLAKEQNNPELGTWKGREFFLKKLARFGSFASKQLGVKEHINHQINVINYVGADNLDNEAAAKNFLDTVAKVNWEIDQKIKKTLELKI